MSNIVKNLLRLTRIQRAIVATMLLVFTASMTLWAQCSVSSPNGSLDYANCDGIGGWAFDGANLNQPITIDIYVDGTKTYSGITANGDRQDLVGAFGNSAARYHGFNYSFSTNASWKNGQPHTISVRICGASNDIGSSPKTVSGCSGGTQPPNPPTSGCNYTEGQFLFTTSWGESVYAHFYNNVLFAALQSGEGFKPQSWLVATGQMTSNVASCFAANDPHTTTNPPVVTPPTNPPTGNCHYSEGQFLFTTSWGESVYAHYYNNTLFAAYQDGNNFRPQHWLVATGQMSSSTASCFAENDPHTTTTPTQNPNPNPNPTTSPAQVGANFGGNLDGADCSGIGGWVVNKNKPGQSTKFDVYINGWLVGVGIPATNSRQDVSNALGISGYNAFGFYMPMPGKYKTGSAMTISVKYSGTQTDIPGSPKTTAACPVNPLGCNGDGAGRVAYAESITHTRSGGVALQLGKEGSSRVSSLTSKLIPVQQGSTYSLDVYAYTPGVQRPNLAPQITAAVVGGALAGASLLQQPTTPDQSRSSVQKAPILGVSIALVAPLIKSLIARRLPRASMELAFYNHQGKFIHRQQVAISKDALGSWELLHIEGHAQETGYVALRLQNPSKTPVWFDDVSFQTLQLPRTSSVTKELFVPKTTTTTSSFASQQPINPESLFRGCTKQEDPIEGGLLDVDVTVVGHGNNGSAGFTGDTGSWGWGPNRSGTGNTGTGTTGGTDGGGSSASSSSVFVPYGAPDNPRKGDSFRSPTGAEYIWDGKSWCIVLKPVDVKGDRPTNPQDGQYYIYGDPAFGVITLYEYVSGRWTMPLKAIAPASGNDYNYDREIANCDSYAVLYANSVSYGKEHGAVITTDGQLISLPSQNNTIEHVNWPGDGQFKDQNGNVIAFIYDEGGKWYVMLDPNTPNEIAYEISGMIHTHPSGPAPNGGIFDTYNPSDDDVQVMNEYPGLNQYLSTDKGTLQFNSSKAIIPGATAPGSLCN